MRITIVLPGVTIFAYGAFQMSNNAKSIKHGEIHMTVFDFDEILCVGLGSLVYISHQMLDQSDLHN